MRTISLSLAAVLALTSCGGGDEPEAAKGGGPGGRGGATKFPVEVVSVQSQPVQYAVSGVGSVEAFETVNVTSRVSGVVDRVLFREGQLVRNGQPLVEVETDRYRLAVAASQGAVQKSEAELREAQAGLARRQSVVESNPGLIRGEEVETWRTRVSTAQADLAQARANLQQAQLNLRDAFVRAPMGGVIQTRTVQTGQFVNPGTVVATLVDRDPLLVRFQVPETDAARIRPGMPVQFAVSEDPNSYTGKLTYLSAGANETTRMLDATAEVTDPRRDALRPGAFARVTIPIPGTSVNPVIPQAAIRPSERGFLAFIVNNGTAEERLLGLGLRTQDGRVEVVSGLQAGDQLVVRGAEALRNGAEVRIVDGSAPQPETGRETTR